MKKQAAAGLVCLAVLVSAVALARADETPRLSDADRSRAKHMLRTVHDAVRRHYFDTTYGGVDLAAHFGRAEAKIDAAPSVTASYEVIAEALLEFGDSHTYFTAPDRPLAAELGWTMRMVGDTCFVTAVVPGSDAARRGLRAGDKVLRFESVIPTRRELWKAEYLATVISPRPLLNLVVQSPGGYPRSLAVRVASAFRQKSSEPVASTFPPPLKLRRTSREKYDVGIWTVADFNLSSRQIDATLDDIRDTKDLILDLRGNGGGDVKALERLAGAFFDHNVKIADLKGRRTMKPLVARKASHTFHGRMIVLVDADSASAAELLARVLQLERRATIIGDRTSGSVRQAVAIKDTIDTDDAPLFYGAVIADAELVMRDGGSLENVGVVPDLVVLPSAEDLAAGRDPVLARALALLGR